MELSIKLKNTYVSSYCFLPDRHSGTSHIINTVILLSMYVINITRSSADWNYYIAKKGAVGTEDFADCPMRGCILRKIPLR